MGASQGRDVPATPIPVANLDGRANILRAGSTRQASDGVDAVSPHTEGCPQFYDVHVTSAPQSTGRVAQVEIFPVTVRKG